MYAQEVAEGVLASQEHASSVKKVKLWFIIRKFKGQEPQNPTCQKVQEVRNVSANWKCRQKKKT